MSYPYNNQGQHPLQNMDEQDMYQQQQQPNQYYNIQQDPYQQPGQGYNDPNQHQFMDPNQGFVDPNQPYNDQYAPSNQYNQSIDGNQQLYTQDPPSYQNDNGLQFRPNTAFSNTNVLNDPNLQNRGGIEMQNMQSQQYDQGYGNPSDGGYQSQQGMHGQDLLQTGGQTVHQQPEEQFNDEQLEQLYGQICNDLQVIKQNYQGQDGYQSEYGIQMQDNIRQLEDAQDNISRIYQEHGHQPLNPEMYQNQGQFYDDNPQAAEERIQFLRQEQNRMMDMLMVEEQQEMHNRSMFPEDQINPPPNLYGDGMSTHPMNFGDPMHQEQIMQGYGPSLTYQQNRDMPGSIQHPKTKVNKDGSLKPVNYDLEDQDEEEPNKFNFRSYKLKGEVSFFGLFCYLILCAAFVAYIVLRIAFTLNLLIFTSYAIVVFVFEIVYGVVLLLVYSPMVIYTKQEKWRADPKGAPPKPKANYHVRCIIPCTLQTFEAIQKLTIQLMNAELPKQCTRTIYVLDDKQDIEKKNWVEGMNNDEIIYVPREVNWYDVNMRARQINYLLKQLYPSQRNKGIVSKKEIICIIPPNQVPSREIFKKTLYLFDGGDDVGLVHAPPCYSNIGVDVLNNSSQFFWETQQRGFDGVGFTCVNYPCLLMIRAKALQEVEWLDENYFGEFYLMGFHFMSTGWKSRMVKEYLTLGKAPESIATSFNHKLEWVRTHYQVLFSGENPLAQKGIPFTTKILALSFSLQFFTNLFLPPLAYVIPIIGCITGIFPIGLNFFSALSVTIWYGVSFIVRSFNNSFRSVRVLWFTNIGHVIFWPFYWIGLLTCGKWYMKVQSSHLYQQIEGQRSRTRRAAGAPYIVPHLLLFAGIVVVIALTFAMYKINLTQFQIISLFWLGYNLIPYYIIIHYMFLDRGTLLRVVSFFAQIVQYGCAAGAIVFLWLKLSKDYDMLQVVNLVYMFYEAAMAGPNAQFDMNRVNFRSPTQIGGVMTQEQQDLSGGWYQMGFFGNTIATVPVAYAVTMLSWSLISYDNGYRAGGNIKSQAYQDVLYGAQFCNKMAVYSSDGETIQYVVEFINNITANSNYNITGNPSSFILPNATQPTINGKPAPATVQQHKDGKVAYQVAANIISCLASSRLALGLSPFTTEASKFQDSAELLYSWMKDAINKGANAGGAGSGDDAKSNVYGVTPNYQSPQGVYDLKYESQSINDDLAFAALWMYRMTQKSQYIQDASTYLQSFTNDDQQTAIGGNPYLSWYNWDVLLWPTLALHSESFQLIGQDSTQESQYALQQLTRTLPTLESYFRFNICPSKNLQYTEKGRAVWRFAPYNDPMTLTDTANTAFLALVYAKYPQLSYTKQIAYKCFALQQIRYILGDTGMSYIVGAGDKYPRHVLNRFAFCSNVGTCSGQQVVAQNSPPNINILHGAFVRGPSYVGDKFQDSYLTKDVLASIEDNASIVGALVALQESGITWEQCQQGFASKYYQKLICQR